jgi:Uma2 family endonuclease
MATLVIDPYVEQQIRSQRAEWGADRFDEVWEGIYIMTPVPNLEHQDMATGLSTIFRIVVQWAGLGVVYQEVNVSDRERGWEQNYRVPDVAVVLNDTRARFCETHLCGGPDFLVEIISPDDRSREKLQFYAKIGVRELMIVDREPWSLELYRLHGDETKLVGTSRLEEPAILNSDVVPVSFRLLPGDARPQIDVTHRDGVQRWLV